MASLDIPILPHCGPLVMVRVLACVPVCQFTHVSLLKREAEGELEERKYG